MAKIIIYLLVIFSILTSTTTMAKKSKTNLMDNIQSGIKIAQQMFGIDTVSDVANLVSRAFSNNIFGGLQQQQQYQPSASNEYKNGEESQINESNDQKKQATNDQQINWGSNLQQNELLGGLFRVMGLDRSQLNAMVINGMIFISQMIQRLLSPMQETPNSQTRDDQAKPFEPERKARSTPLGTPIDWILDNPSETLSELLKNAQDKNLPENIVKMINTIIPASNFNSENIDCVRLLVCKLSPFLWEMQRGVQTRIDNRKSNTQSASNDDYGVNSFFRYLPDGKEFKLHGDACEERYKNCNIYSIDSLSN